MKNFFVKIPEKSEQNFSVEKSWRFFNLFVHQVCERIYIRLKVRTDSLLQSIFFWLKIGFGMALDQNFIII